MPLFTLPLAQPNQRPRISRVRSAQTKDSLSSRKRKRDSQSPIRNTSSQANDSDDFPSDEELQELNALTNPLSLAPDEILQYQLAGLGLDKPLPKVKDFPHRAVVNELAPNAEQQARKKIQLRRKHSSEDGLKDSDDEVSLHDEDTHVEENVKSGARGPHLRMQHLSVLTTILHKCLLYNDIPRASRAFAMLLRTQVGGRELDLRSTGYWIIGAHLLNQSEEKPTVNSPSFKDGNGSVGSSNEEFTGREREWGTKDGRTKARDYFMKLILQHPYKRQFHGTVTALRIWPIMVTWEIYGIQHEQKERLRQIAAATDGGKDFDGSEDGAMDDSVDSDESNISSEFQERNYQARTYHRQENAWIRREEVRQETLAAAEKIASRLDELMTNPPYSDYQPIMEIRAHLAAYVSDLSVPEKPIEDDGDAPYDSHGDGRLRRIFNPERRLLIRNRLHNHESGKKKREEGLKTTRNIVSRVLKAGGNAEDFAHLDLGAASDTS